MPNESILLLKGAISTGDGRNASVINGGLAYTGKLEILPFGSFNNNGDYSEGDIAFETDPKLTLGGLTYSKNQKANRTGGQLGQELYDFRYMSSLIIDGVFKYQGWVVLSEYMNR